MRRLITTFSESLEYPHHPCMDLILNEQQNLWAIKGTLAATDTYSDSHIIKGQQTNGVPLRTDGFLVKCLISNWPYSEILLYLIVCNMKMFLVTEYLWVAQYYTIIDQHAIRPKELSNLKHLVPGINLNNAVMRLILQDDIVSSCLFNCEPRNFFLKQNSKSDGNKRKQK